VLQPKKTAKADGAKRNDPGQLTGSQPNTPSKKRKRGEDEEPSRPRKRVKQEELSDTKSTKISTVKKSKSELETHKPGKVIGALIGKKRRLKKVRRGGG